MLRKLHAIFARIAGKDDDAQFLPIPDRDPAIYVPRSQAESYYRFLSECLDQLGARYELEEQRGFEGRLRSFADRGNPKQLSLLHACRLRHARQACFWLTLAYHERVREGRHLYEMPAIRQAVVVDLQFNAGNVLIRPENIRDKIAELFVPIDIDFQHESSFSGKYFLLADDEKKVRSHLPRSFLQLMSRQSGLIVRLGENEALVARDRSIRVKDALQLAEVGFAMSECR